jgi:hypothetical protein
MEKAINIINTLIIVAAIIIGFQYEQSLRFKKGKEAALVELRKDIKCTEEYSRLLGEYAKNQLLGTDHFSGYLCKCEKYWYAYKLLDSINYAENE